MPEETAPLKWWEKFAKNIDTFSNTISGGINKVGNAVDGLKPEIETKVTINQNSILLVFAALIAIFFVVKMVKK